MKPKAVPVSHRPPLVGCLPSDLLYREQHPPAHGSLFAAVFKESGGLPRGFRHTMYITEAFPPAELGFALARHQLHRVGSGFPYRSRTRRHIGICLGLAFHLLRNNPLQSGRSGHRLARFTSFPTQELKNAFD